MMRYYTIIILVANLLTACSQNKKKVTFEKIPIDYKRIDRIQISKRNIPPDTAIYYSRVLDQDQLISFCEKWNQTDKNGLYKFLPTYNLTLYLKHGAIRRFRVNGSLIKENNDYCGDFGDTNFFHDLYINAHEFVNTYSKTLNTGWYYISENVTNFKRQLDKTSEFFYLDSIVIVSADHFNKFDLTYSKYEAEKYPILIIYFDKKGTENWNIATDKMIGKQLGLIINDKLVITPKVNTKITAGVSAINRIDYSYKELEEILRSIENSKTY